MQGEGAVPGSSMLAIYRAMCSEYHPPLFAPIEMELDMEGRTATVRVPGLIDTAVEPIKNRVTGAEHRARIDLPNGKEFYFAEVASGTSKASGAVAFEISGSHAHFAHGAVSNNGLTA